MSLVADCLTKLCRLSEIPVLGARVVARPGHPDGDVAVFRTADDRVFAVLDRSREYVAYCQSGRRSAAAAFLFAQRGFKVWLLEGGLRSVEKGA